MTVWMLVPACLVLGLFLVSFALDPGKRAGWRFLNGAALACIFGDALLLACLPVLGWSFAPSFFPPFYLFSMGRTFVLALGLVTVVLVHSEKWRWRAAQGFASVQLVLLLLAFYGMYLEPFWLTASTVAIQSPDFMAGRPLRILQISDLHVERTTRREADILAQVDVLQPDLIVLTGDYMNIDYVLDAQTFRDTRQFLQQLHAPLGVFAILGTPGVDVPHLMPELFAGLDIRLLNDEIATISLPGGDLSIIGVRFKGRERDTLKLYNLARKLPPGAFSLLLYHTPDLAYDAAAADIDLYLAGHTHGGQVRLPFYGALITFSEYGKAFEMGEYHLDTTTLYVSRGLGMEGLGLPRIRFLAPPELVLIELSSLEH